MRVIAHYNTHFPTAFCMRRFFRYRIVVGLVKGFPSSDGEVTFKQADNFPNFLLKLFRVKKRGFNSIQQGSEKSPLWLVAVLPVAVLPVNRKEGDFFFFDLT